MAITDKPVIHLTYDGEHLLCGAKRFDGALFAHVQYAHWEIDIADPDCRGWCEKCQSELALEANEQDFLSPL